MRPNSQVMGTASALTKTIGRAYAQKGVSEDFEAEPGWADDDRAFPAISHQALVHLEDVPGWMNGEIDQATRGAYGSQL